MKQEIPENPYEAWLAQRRQDFTGVDLSYLVGASVRSIDPRPGVRNPRFASYTGFPSTFLGVARLIFFALLILTPA